MMVDGYLIIQSGRSFGVKKRSTGAVSSKFVGKMPTLLSNNTDGTFVGTCPSRQDVGLSCCSRR